MLSSSGCWIPEDMHSLWKNRFSGTDCRRQAALRCVLTGPLEDCNSPTVSSPPGVGEHAWEEQRISLGSLIGHFLEPLALQAKTLNAFKRAGAAGRSSPTFSSQLLSLEHSASMTILHGKETALSPRPHAPSYSHGPQFKSKEW